MKSVFRSSRFSWTYPCFLSLLPLLPVAAPSQQFTRNELTASIGLQTVGQQTCVLIGSGPECQPETNHFAYLSLPSFTYSRNLSPSLALKAWCSQPLSFFKPMVLAPGDRCLPSAALKLAGEASVGVFTARCAPVSQNSVAAHLITIHLHTRTAPGRRISPWSMAA